MVLNGGGRDENEKSGMKKVCEKVGLFSGSFKSFKKQNMFFDLFCMILGLH